MAARAPRPGRSSPHVSGRHLRPARGVHEAADGPPVEVAGVKALLHSAYDQPDHLPAVAEHLDSARGDVLAFTMFPMEIRRQIWFNNLNERLIREIRRRTEAVGVFPDRTSIIRLVRAVVAEQHDEWAEARRYLGLDALAKARLTLIANPEEDPPPSLLPYQSDRSRRITPTRTQPPWT